MTTELEVLATTWAAAEERGDVNALDALLVDDFMGVGPVGFTLPKEAWLGRFAGGLRYERLWLEEVSMRSYGNASVIVAHQHAIGTHQGAPTPAESRVSVVVVRSDERTDWRIAGIHYSFIAGASGAPV
jgi:ketosteroid isomerase-like protein